MYQWLIPGAVYLKKKKDTADNKNTQKTNKKQMTS